MDFKFNKLFEQIITESDQLGVVNHVDTQVQIQSFKQLIKDLREEFKIRLNVEDSGLQICGTEVAHITWLWRDKKERTKKMLWFTIDMITGEITCTEDGDEDIILNDFKPLDVQKTVKWVVNEFIKAPVNPAIEYEPHNDDVDQLL